MALTIMANTRLINCMLPSHPSMLSKMAPGVLKRAMSFVSLFMMFILVILF